MKTQIESPHPVLLEVKNLKKHFQVKVPNHETQTVHALNGISFLLHEGETLGLVGESGCGKSTAARAILRLVEPTSGEVFYRNHNLITLKQNKLRSLRKEMQIIFQDPLASLNPRKLIKKILEEPFDIHGFSKSKEKEKMFLAFLYFFVTWTSFFSDFVLNHNIFLPPLHLFHKCLES